MTGRSSKVTSRASSLETAAEPNRPLSVTGREQLCVFSVELAQDLISPSSRQKVHNAPSQQGRRILAHPTPRPSPHLVPADLANATGWHEVKIISQRIGHSSVGFTIGTYAHVLPSVDEETVNTLAQLILGRTA